jgi:NAD(P)-dependent dehydrogenase (short-subunit alcohol dehydrogenase family)
VASSLLSGRRALVTGAAGGVGSAVVEAFLEHGAEVVGADIAESDEVVWCDVTDEDSLRAVFANGPFDDVVHAAGTVAIGDVRDLELAAFRRVLEVNLVGSFLVGREAARRPSEGSTVTFIASQGGRKGGAGWSAYCASKFGMIGFAESLAQELAPEGMRVNSVCPGVVDTEMTWSAIRRLAEKPGETAEEIGTRYAAGVPLGRFASPREIADVCVFLASPLARYVIGASLVVDGGELS